MDEDEQLREQIIDAAIDSFTEQGLKFTMNDLAKKLGISKKTIYTVLESKQMVLKGIADRYASDFKAMQEEIEADESLDLKGKIERMLCALPTQYYNIGLSRMYELSAKYPKEYRYLMESVNQGWALVERYIRRGVKEGVLRKISIPVAMTMIKGTVKCFLESDVLDQNKLSYEQGKEQMIDSIMKGMEQDE